MSPLHSRLRHDVSNLFRLLYNWYLEGFSGGLDCFDWLNGCFGWFGQSISFVTDEIFWLLTDQLQKNECLVSRILDKLIAKGRFWEASLIFVDFFDWPIGENRVFGQSMLMKNCVQGVFPTDQTAVWGGLVSHFSNFWYLDIFFVYFAGRHLQWCLLKPLFHIWCSLAQLITMSCGFCFGASMVKIENAKEFVSVGGLIPLMQAKLVEGHL